MTPGTVIGLKCFMGCYACQLSWKRLAPKRECGRLAHE